MKKIDTSAQIGDSGVALIHQLVNKIGFVWHERKIDAGIDGEIELRNPVTGDVANRFLLVQSKASERTFPGETEHSFYYLCSEADLAYWMAADVPVLLVCSHPARDEAWWMHVQGWFTDSAKRASRRIDFDKRSQVFDATAAHRLLNLADHHGDAHVPVAEHQPEQLTSNLLPVTLPPALYSMPTALPGADAVLEAQRESGADRPICEDFVLHRGQVYSWRSPAATALGELPAGEAHQVPTAEWSAEASPVRERLIVNLLNRTLRSDLAVDCAWHVGRKILYWRPTSDLAAKSIRSVTGRTRSVFKPKMKKGRPEEVGYYLHAALDWRFLTVDGQWYCTLSPTSHYTRDGYRDSLFISEYLAGIKRLDKNLAVFHQTRMWAHYLNGGGGSIDFEGRLLTFGPLATFEADRGINDAAWVGSIGKASHGNVDLVDGFDLDEDDPPTLFEAVE